MKTPVLYLKQKHTKTLLDNTIASNIRTCGACMHLRNKYDATLKSILQSLCYKIFFIDVRFTPEKQYSISDACYYIDGIFKEEMIKTLYDFVNYSLQGDLKCLYNVLKNCYSYELLQMLYDYPVKLYACILGIWCFEHNDFELFDLCCFYVDNDSKQPTLDWERLYLQFMERYENV